MPLLAFEVKVLWLNFMTNSHVVGSRRSENGAKVEAKTGKRQNWKVYAIARDLTFIILDLNSTINEGCNVIKAFPSITGWAGWKKYFFFSRFFFFCCFQAISNPFHDAEFPSSNALFRFSLSTPTLRVVNSWITRLSNTLTKRAKIGLALKWRTGKLFFHPSSFSSFFFTIRSNKQI